VNYELEDAHQFGYAVPPSPTAGRLREGESTEREILNLSERNRIRNHPGKDDHQPQPTRRETPRRSEGV